METLVVILLAALLGIIIAVANHISTKKAEKLENEQLLPILEYLYKSHNGQSEHRNNELTKHQEFITKIKSINQRLKGQEVPTYTPDIAIFQLLVQHSCKYPTNMLGHERFMKMLDMSTQISLPHFAYLIEEIKKSPDNTLLFEILFKSIAVSKFLPEIVVPILIYSLEQNPTDPLGHEMLMRSIDKLAFPSKDFRQIVYSKSLEILEQYPDDVNAKKFVLNTGRWYFGKLRGGKPTIYDEQAIQNDIAVRSNRQ
jgi:hypothetical protein